MIYYVIVCGCTVIASGNLKGQQSNGIISDLNRSLVGNLKTAVKHKAPTVERKSRNIQSIDKIGFGRTVCFISTEIRDGIVITVFQIFICVIQIQKRLFDSRRRRIKCLIFICANGSICKSAKLFGFNRFRIIVLESILISVICR